MATSETVNIWVNVKGNASKALTGITSQLKKNNDQVKKNAISWKGMATAVGGMVVLAKVNAWTKESIRLAKEQEKAEKKLSASLGYTSQALLDYASALQKKTTYGDEEIIASSALVANFIKEEEQIKRIIAVSQDLATAKGMSLSQATDLVTKSVASSTNAMARYGIEIEGAAGSVERIDNAVLALNDAFGGMAEAIAQTDAGKIEQMENTIGDLREEVGEKLLPAMVDIKEATLGFYEALADEDGVMQNAIGYLAKLAKQTATVIGWYNGGKKAWEDSADATWRYNESMQAQNKILVDLFKNKRKMQDWDYTGFNKNAIDANNKAIDAARAEKQRLKDNKVAHEAYQEELVKIGTVSNKKKKKLRKEDAEDQEEVFNYIAEKTLTWQEELAENDKQLRLQMGEDAAIAREEAAQKEIEQKRQLANTSIDIAMQTANSIKNIISAVQNRRQQEYDNEVALQKEQVKNSSMSAKQKATALDKIDKEAAKKRHELRLKEWRTSILTSIVDTQLAAAKTMATMGYPAGIPFAIAAQAAGTVSTGIIMANKPKMYNGGELTNTSGMTGDVIPFIGRKGEEVVTPEEKANMQGGQTITIGAPIINISGNADESIVSSISEQLQAHARTIEDMFVNGAINTNIINGALSR